MACGVDVFFFFFHYKKSRLETINKCNTKTSAHHCVVWPLRLVDTFSFSVISFQGDFLKTLEDPDLNVRRVALVTFNSAAHNKPSLIRELLDSVLPQLYNETKVRKELIREVRDTKQPRR